MWCRLLPAPIYSGAKFRLANTNLRVTASPSDVAATRVLLQSSKKPAQYPSGIRDRLQRKLFRMPTSCCSSAPSAGAGRSSASFDRLFRSRQPQRRFTHIAPIAIVLIGVGEKRIPKSENWIPSTARSTHPQPLGM